ncbi:MAG: hypothetical protein U9R79_10965 [Armatimonadota bacterium]|nr:hypothetical protein [Armatimonadota bacterium]
MEQRRERMLAVAGLLVVIAITAAQVALVIMHMFVPMVEVADRLTREESYASAQGPDRTVQRLGDAAGSPWRWLSLALTVVAAATTAYAVFRLHRSRAAVLRWAWVVRTGVMLIPLGLIVFWMLSGPALWYRDFFGQGAGP